MICFHLIENRDSKFYFHAMLHKNKVIEEFVLLFIMQLKHSPYLSIYSFVIQISTQHVFIEHLQNARNSKQLAHGGDQTDKVWASQNVHPTACLCQGRGEQKNGGRQTINFSTNA